MVDGRTKAVEHARDAERQMMYAVWQVEDAVRAADAAAGSEYSSRREVFLAADAADLAEEALLLTKKAAERLDSLVSDL